MEHPEDVTEDFEEMDEPVACFTCGTIIELGAANFFTEACSCNTSDGRCSHGTCDECYAGENTDIDED